MADPVAIKKGPGRPLGGKNQKPAKTYRNFTLDADIMDLLNRTVDQMEVELGFRPTLSQTIRRLLTQFAKENPK